MTYIITV